MKAHVFITDRETFPVVRDNGFWGVGIDGIPSSYRKVLEENLRNPKKPYFGMIADILGTRVGDIVFLYERQVGFHGIYKVRSEPFFDPTPVGCVGANYPIRVEIECLNFFPKPVPESLLFSTREYESKCWGWFYRKIQGARGINTVNPETAEVLIELLVKLNGNAINKPNNMKSYKDATKEMSNAKEKIELNLAELSKDGKIFLEDILRAWLMKNIDNPAHKSLRKMLGPVEDIEWFANNVPYHVTRKNIDILIYHKNDKYTGYPLRYKYTVIELKKDRANTEDVSQLIEYSKWAAGRLANGEVEMVKPILIAFDFSKDAITKVKNSDFSVECYKYRVIDNNIEFKKEEI